MTTSLSRIESIDTYFVFAGLYTRIVQPWFAVPADESHARYGQTQSFIEQNDNWVRMIKKTLVLSTESMHISTCVNTGKVSRLKDWDLLQFHATFE